MVAALAGSIHRTEARKAGAEAPERKGGWKVPEEELRLGQVGL